jgi:hypothetical protein
MDCTDSIFTIDLDVFDNSAGKLDSAISHLIGRDAQDFRSVNMSSKADGTPSK